MDKQSEYRDAMKRHDASAVYRNLGTAVSSVIVTLQLVGLIRTDWSSTGVSWLAIVFVAYVLADFVNGLVHMVMDCAEDYTSAIGPLVAAFHRHHHHPRYNSRHWLLVYYSEGGMKNWLAVYMVGFALVQSSLPASVAFGALAFSLLSSFAELSHYLCHNSTHAFVKLLQNVGVLLHPDHHRVHHETVNSSYGFLNGMTDPVLDRIARHAYQDGHASTDQHSRAYYE